MSVKSIEPLIKTTRDDDQNTAVQSGSNNNIKTVKLIRGPEGYGIYLREAVSGEKMRDYEPTDIKPSAQLIIDVDVDGTAQKAGVQGGDFVLEVNNEDVRKKSHTELLALIGSNATEVVMKVCHVPMFKVLALEAKQFKSDYVNKKGQQGDSDDKVKVVYKEKELPPPPPASPPSYWSYPRPKPAFSKPLFPKPNASRPRVQFKEITGSPNSARRRRIKVLPKSESDNLKPDELFEVSVGADPNKRNQFKTDDAQVPVRILPIDCDSATIWEQARKMQERRRGSNMASPDDDSFIPDTKPDIMDPQKALEDCRDHPFKWDIYQTGVWIKSFDLPKVAEIFEFHEIRGEHLQYIGKDDLKSIGITDQGTLDTMGKEIEALLKKYNSGGRI